MIRYATIEEFNVDSKAECDQLNLAHVARKKYKKKKKLKQTNASACLVQYLSKIHEGSSDCGTRKTIWKKGFVKEMSFKCELKGQESDRWQQASQVQAGQVC